MNLSLFKLLHLIYILNANELNTIFRTKIIYERQRSDTARTKSQSKTEAYRRLLSTTHNYINYKVELL